MVPAWRRSSMRSRVSFSESRFAFTSCCDLLDRRRRRRRRRGRCLFGLGLLRGALGLAAFGGGVLRAARELRWEPVCARARPRPRRRLRRGRRAESIFRRRCAREKFRWWRRLRGRWLRPAARPVLRRSCSGGSIGGRRRGSGDGNVEAHSLLKGFLGENVEALLLARGGESGAGNLHGGRNHEQDARRRRRWRIP